ncbi:MAG TPA: EmrA/EmrK family multidrug efflux transporter periplasmic adaptor subunit, partial [Dokdonella sp.]|nr:EmrA/EmrK family multidrug efflux transporter periplasmic adaptor subunit [Dokdonella sp.]
MSDSQTPAAGTAGGPPKNGNNGRRRVVLAIIALAFVAIGVAWYLLWLFVWSQREITDDAYVAGNQVILSTQVPGTVVAVLADDTQRVEAGQ